MPSIMSQNLYQRVTSDVQIRKIEKIDPTKYQKSIMQVSDQQARDKEYEKNITYLRTYLGSLQAKLNTVVEELNNSYDTMLNEMLYKKADSKDTAKLLNSLPNASNLDTCLSTAGQKYDPKALEITPYAGNVKNYQYNTMFGSKALDLSNYYDYGQTNNTTVARSYYEKGDPNASNPSNYHELGTSVFGTLNYLWAWDLDRVNATYATTKDSFVDANGILHVPPNDTRKGGTGVVEDSTLAIATATSGSGGNANNLQVNVTSLQPNRGVFLPNTEKPSNEVVLLKEDFEARDSGPASLPKGWTSTYEQSNLNVSGKNAKDSWAHYGLQNYYGINQWGVDDSPPVSNNSLEKYFDTDPIPSSGLPSPTQSSETAGYLSSSSVHFGNIRNVTYDDIVYEPHTTYRFDPNFVREHFSNTTGSAAKTPNDTSATGLVNTMPTTTTAVDVNNNNSNTDALNFTYNSGAGNIDLLDTSNTFDPLKLSGQVVSSPSSVVDYQGAQVISGTKDPAYGNAFGSTPSNGGTVTPDLLNSSPLNSRNVLDINYSNTVANDDGGITVSTPKFDLSQFEDVVMNAKSYYEIESFIRKQFNQSYWVDSVYDPITGSKLFDYEWHWRRTYLEYAQQSASLRATDTSINPLTGANDIIWQTIPEAEKYLDSLSASKDESILAIIVAVAIIVAGGGLLGAAAALLLIDGNSNEGRWDLIEHLMFNYRNNISRFPVPNWTNEAFKLIETKVAEGRANMGIDFTMISNIEGLNGGDLTVPSENGSASGYVDYRRGLDVSYDSTGNPATYVKNNNPYNSTKWQLDDVNIKAKGYSRGELISPKIDFSQMESGYVEFYDRVETNKAGFNASDFTHKEVWYSFDYDEANPGLANWKKLNSISKTGTSEQLNWKPNSGEIPCAGGESNVRIKFVFDTRDKTNRIVKDGTNIIDYSDFDGWNIDNIKFSGKKANPTDFYYYRQDLNSEFVTGSGAKLINTTPDISGFTNVTSKTDTDPTGSTSSALALYKNNTVLGVNPTPEIKFNITSPINTTSIVAPVSFSSTVASNTQGLVTSNITPVPNVPVVIDALTSAATAGTSSINVTDIFAFANHTEEYDPFIGPIEPAYWTIKTPDIYINGVHYTVTSISTPAPASTPASPYPGTINISPSIPASGYPINQVIKKLVPLSPTSKNLFWDITSTSPATTSSSAPVSFSFTAPDVKQLNPSTGLQEQVIINPWGAIKDINGNPIIPVNPVTGAIDPITMVDSAPIDYISVTPAKSTKEINFDLSSVPASNTSTITFNYTGKDVSTAGKNIRRVDIIKEIMPGVWFPTGITQNFTPNTDGTSKIGSIDISSLQGNTSPLKAVFVAESADGLREKSSTITNIDYWNIADFKIETKTPAPSKVGKYTSVFETQPYTIANNNSLLSFDYSASDDPTGIFSVDSRKVSASINGGAWTEILNVVDPTTGTTTPIYQNEIIDIGTLAPAGSSLKLKFESVIDVPDQVNIPSKNDIFNVKNIKFTHPISDNYNVAESTAPANTNRPNISFDPRGYNIEGRYTDVNGRTQISNTDFPMFSNAILTAVESDAARLQAYRGDTYAEWVGLNTKTPARVLDMLTGKVKPQLTGNFVISKDGLNNYYDTTKSGVLTDMYVDDAVAINTGKIVGKTTTKDDINQGTTGWINAVTTGNKIWIPYIGATKYDESSSSYKDMTIWGKKTFLLDPLPTTPAPIASISANDDAYLYVNGFNVRSTAYAETTPTATTSTLTMIDATDYTVGEIVIVNGITGTVTATTSTSITLSAIPTTTGSILPGIGTFDQIASGKTPYTVYHVDPIKNNSNVNITTTALGSAQSNTLLLTSIDHLKIGQTIYVNGQALTIEKLNASPNKITFRPLLAKDIPSGSLLAYNYSDSSASTNVGGGAAVTGAGLTNSNSTAQSYNILPILRKGFNTVGVKATEDRGTGENFEVKFSNMVAKGDSFSLTGGTSGIDTDTTWAVKVSPNGYDGSIPFNTGSGGYNNAVASPLYQSEIDDLFKSEKTDKMETTVHFINQDPNGVGKLSLIKGIEVNVIGEPTIQTIKRNKFSTETFENGSLSTQLTKGFVNGLEQTGTGLALKFEPTIMTGKSLNYMTDLSGKADINVFFDKKDSMVNDATMNVSVKYIEDSNGDGKITGVELTELKTRIIGMQDTRDNKTLNPNSDASAPAIAGLRERYDYVETTLTSNTANTITVSNTKNFAVGDYIRIEDPAIGHQAVQITSLTSLSGAGTIRFAPNLQFTPTSGSRVTSYRLLTDVDQAEASKLYLGSNYVTTNATGTGIPTGYTKNTVTTNEQYLVASKGRNGGSTATGNENKITARLKQILDGDEFQEMLKYGLLDGIYIAATASDNRGDQIVGKLMLDWDWRKKKILVKQGSFSAIYKS